MIRRVLALRKSMFGQMALLTAIFLGWGLYAFAIRPILDIVPAQEQPPIEATGDRLRDALHGFMTAQRDAPGSVPPIAQDATIRAVLARNPDFRYHVRVGDRSFGNGQPIFYERLHLDRLERVHRAMPALGICSQFANPMEGGGPGSYVDFYMCDRVTYFEYRGLTRPIAGKSAGATTLYDKWLWSFSGNFLLAALGVFLIFALILSAHMLLIRRLAALARSFDPQHLDRQLPEKGLATEIIPLVRAVNHMMAQVSDYQRRNGFFLSAAAHEMRTPLTVLRTRLELMEDDGLKAKLIGDVRRLTELVNQLLALMSIGNRKELTGAVDLADCVRRVVSDLGPMAAAQGIAIHAELAAPAGEIIGDAALIRSAIANLVGNAVSFSPDGGDVVVQVDEHGRLTVRDHGPGLGTGDPAMLFEPFVRAPTTRRGYGLGLAIVKAVVALHGGIVHGAKADGGGAVFTIAFPVRSGSVSSCPKQ